MQSNEEVVYLYLDDIIPNRFQPREVFDDKPLKELAVSIKEHGVIQPIIVRRVNDKYEIIAGERRYKASALAGLTKIPAIIRDLDDKETSKVALLENLQRKNLNPIEEAKTYQKILELDQMTQEELAKTMGKSQSAVANKLRLLALPDEVQEALLKEQISERHARSLLNLDTAEEQKKMMQQVIANKMTVRQLEEIIKNKNSKGEDLKKEDEGVKNMNIDIPSETSFIPENPLMPNLDGTDSNSNTPILTSMPTSVTENAPNNTSSTNKFLNFGEINKNNAEEIEMENNQNNNQLFFQNDDYKPVNVETIKENAIDINSNQPENRPSGQNLDSLLNIKAPIPSESNNDDNFKFFSPAKEALIESEKDDTSAAEDYFQEPDLIPIDLPHEERTNNINSVNLNSNDSNEPLIINNQKDNLNVAIDKLRNVVKEIEQLNIKVSFDEMSLDKSYQVVIKMEKQ